MAKRKNRNRSRNRAKRKQARQRETTNIAEKQERTRSKSLLGWLSFIIGLVSLSVVLYLNGTNIKISITQTSDTNPYLATIELENSGFRTTITGLMWHVKNFTHAKNTLRGNIFVMIDRNISLGWGGYYSKDFFAGGNGEKLEAADLCAIARGLDHRIGY